MDRNQKVTLSKFLSYLLRHGAEKGARRPPFLTRSSPARPPPLIFFFCFSSRFFGPNFNELTV